MLWLITSYQDDESNRLVEDAICDPAVYLLKQICGRHEDGNKECLAWIIADVLKDQDTHLWLCESISLPEPAKPPDSCLKSLEDLLTKNTYHSL